MLFSRREEEHTGWVVGVTEKIGCKEKEEVT